ncbi:MAG: MerR family transcriptional regulator, partial [Ilumatobacteraceae bacterium]
MTTYALTRPVRLDLDAFARAAGLHPDVVRRFVALGLIEASRDSA